VTTAEAPQLPSAPHIQKSSFFQKTIRYILHVINADRRGGVMHTYSLGLLQGQSPQHVLTLQAHSLTQAQKMWAAKKNVLHTADWDADHATCKGIPLICFTTSDPAVRAAELPGTAPPQPEAAPRHTEQPQNPTESDSILLTPPKEVPDFAFRQDWKEEGQEENGRPSGFDDDKPI
jgi:hypothetical protein